MTLPKSIADKLILQGKATTLGRVYTDGKTFTEIQRFDVGRIDRVFIGYGDRRHAMVAMLAVTLLLLTGCKTWNHEPQVAGGEWRVEVQVPPCDSNLKVTLPKEPGGPIAVECRSMPVATR